MSEDPKHRVLVVEDDLDIARLVQVNLIDSGYDVEAIEDGAVALERIKAASYSLIVLDVMLPTTDGFEVCKQLRGRGDLTPILMLTCRASDADKVLSLEFGADDHLAKPFSLDELRARVRALIRRSYQWSQGAEKNLLALGPITLDLGRREAKKNGVTIELTAKEFDLLHFLITNRNHVFSRAILLDKIWDYQSEVYEHTVTSHVNRLRAKLEDDPQNPKFIVTVRGVGYKAADTVS